ncbi:hypothetical protein [Anaeromicrobium sediminis]|uniref:Na+-translocating membrane potential-generating system MpsC domain-containing protein n=1 Tax=Anaeromicrobium sediminis TaxID=1478221 RepID=A0A267MJ00_9FIRM|nr:hypothetical protein [Anaeromicrobium sediminis]PAB59506.1 hypothetical protein CCE28_09835 [Anaeromicrobium sediminis]
MKHNNKRISKIVDELINYFFSIGGTDISINVQNLEKHHKIFFQSNYKNEQDEKINKLIKYLSYPKQEEIEEYYWELMGDCDVDTELSLIGMMIDEAEVNFVDDKIQITLYRNK